MKKTVLSFFIMTIVSILVLSACSSEKTSTTTGKSGKVQLAQGVTDKEILIGHLGPQTGPVAIYDYFRKGIDSYFKYVNENGGVNGRKLKLIAYDDQYQPALAVKNAQRIVEQDKVFAMLGDVCTPCNTAARKIFETKGIPMVMVSSGAQEFVNPPIKNYFGTSILNYRVETRVFLDYAVNELKAKNIAVVYQNDDYGKEGFIAVKENINKYSGVKLVGEVPYVAGELNMSSQAQHIKELNPDAIITLAVPNQAANLKKELYKIGLKNIPYIVSSVGANDRNLFKLAGADVWEGTISAAAFPMPDVSTDPSMKTYVERFSKDYPGEPVDGFSQNGWAIAEVLVEGLKRTGKDLTWDNFYKAMNSFDNWDGSIYEGVTISKDNHYGLTTMLLTQAKGGKIVPIPGKIKFNPADGKITYEK